MTNRKILVTGADGFIGSHLTERLVREGHDVRAFVWYNSFDSWGWLDHSPRDVQKSLEVFSGDIRDANGVREAVRGCDVVLHLAALIGIPYSYRSPGSYVETNVNGTLNILQAARDFSVRRVVHTSTSEVYGTAQFVPITEKHPLQGQSPYSATKIGADQLALSFHSSFGLPVTIVRPFNTYGPRQSTRAVIPTVITQIASGANRIRLGSLSPTRDFNFVADTVAGFVAAARSESGAGEVFNLSSNFEVSIGKTVQLIQELMGKKVEVVTEDARIRPDKSEVERLWGDNSKSLSAFGWSPAYSGLEGLTRGLKESIDWFTVPENLARYKTDRYTV